MGGNSTSRLDSADAEVITVVKGIRLTDRVIDRMKESPQAVYKSKSQAPPPVARPVDSQDEALSPRERLVPILPHPPSYASSLVPPPIQEPVTPLVPFVPVSQDSPAPPSPEDSSTPDVAVSPVESPAEEHVAITLPTEPVITSPTSPAESESLTASAEPTVSSPPPEPLSTSPPLDPVELLTTEPTSTPINTSSAAEPVNVIKAPQVEEPVLFPPPVPVVPLENSSDSQDRNDEPADMPGSPSGDPISSSSPLSIPLPSSPDLEELVPPQSSSALVIPSESSLLGQTQPPTEETSAPPTSAPSVDTVVPPVLPPLTETLSSLPSPPKQQTAVTEEELRKQIRDELKKRLQEEMKMAELKLREQFEEEKVKAEAQAKAQLQIQAEVQKTLEREQIALQQSLKDAIMKERQNTEDERLVAQYYWMERKIQKLEEKEQDLAKQDFLYRQQITKLEEKTAQFTRVTAESFRKGLEDTRSRFKKYQTKPVCSELQSEILKCYREHTGQTLTCSNIASLYMQCVDNAKQNKKVSTGG